MAVSMAGPPLLSFPFFFLLCVAVAWSGKLAQAYSYAVHHAVSHAG